MPTKHRITWPANPATENIIAYQVFESFNGGLFNLHAEVPATSAPIQVYEKPDPTPGQWAYKIAARNSVGVGEVSEATSAPTLPSKVGNPTLEVIVT